MTEEVSMGKRVGTVLLWLLTVAVALPVILAGATKFQPGGMWPELFAGWSLPIWFMYVIGVLEVAGGIALLVPRFASYAAIVLGVVMLGAAYTLLTNPGEMGATPPLANIVSLTIIGVARWGRRGKPA